MMLSIIIVNWNTRELLLNCIRSIYEYIDIDAFEIIVVDNGSIDQSVNSLKQYFPEVKCYSLGENVGFAKANNIGLTKAKGNFLALVNSDVVLIEPVFKNLINYLKLHDNVVLVGPRILNNDLSLQRSWMGEPTLWGIFCRAFFLDRIFKKIKIFNTYLLANFPPAENNYVDVLNGCFWVFTKELIEKFGIFDDKYFIYGEDLDFCKNIRINGKRIKYVAEARAVHYGGQSSKAMPIKFYIEMQKSNLRYYKKWHSIKYRAFSGLLYTYNLNRYFIHYILSKVSKSDAIYLKTKMYKAATTWMHRKK